MVHDSISERKVTGSIPMHACPKGFLRAGMVGYFITGEIPTYVVDVNIIACALRIIIVSALRIQRAMYYVNHTNSPTSM